MQTAAGGVEAAAKGVKTVFFKQLKNRQKTLRPNEHMSENRKTPAAQGTKAAMGGSLTGSKLRTRDHAELEK